MSAGKHNGHANSEIRYIHDPNGLKLLNRLRLGLSRLDEHKFNHNFKECVNPHAQKPFLMNYNELQSVDEN